MQKKLIYHSLLFLLQKGGEKGKRRGREVKRGKGGGGRGGGQ